MKQLQEKSQFISLNTIFICDLSNPVVEANDWPQFELYLNFSKHLIKPPIYIFASEVTPKAAAKISLCDMIKSNFVQTFSIEVHV